MQIILTVERLIGERYRSILCGEYCWRNKRTDSLLWRGDHWLGSFATAAMIQMVNREDHRQPEPLSVDGQRRLIANLLAHLQRLVLFALHSEWKRARVEVDLPKLRVR